MGSRQAAARRRLRYAESSNHTVVHEFSDAAVSGRDPIAQRPGFNAAIRYCLKNFREKQHKGPEKATALDSAWLLAELEVPRRLREPPPLFAMNLCTGGEGGGLLQTSSQTTPQTTEKVEKQACGGESKGGWCQ